MRIFLGVVTALALLSMGGAYAQSQSEMTRQAAESYRTADAELNATYRTLMANLSPDAQRLLRESQRAWIPFRDAECQFKASGAQGGSIYPTTHSLCLEDITRERIRQLQASANCPEGDLSCPR